MSPMCFLIFCLPLSCSHAGVCCVDIAAFLL